MSDKNRNMNDINDQKTAEQQAFSEEIRRRLAEPGSGKPTLDEFKVMVYKDREKRRKKRNALVACIVAAFIVGYLTYDDLVPEVGADKNPKETIVTEDGVIIEDGGWGSSGINMWYTEEWNDIEHANKVYPMLLVPRYIPNNYMFDSLQIESVETGATTYEYFFVNDKNSHIEIEIYLAKGTNTLELVDVSKTVECDKGKVYFQENNKKATIQNEDGYIISIWGNLSQKEFLRIINNL